MTPRPSFPRSAWELSGDIGLIPNNIPLPLIYALTSGVTMRLRLVFSCSLVLVGVLLSVWFLVAHSPGVTLSNFQRLHDEMSLDQISEILGRPPDNFESAGGQWVAWWVDKEGTIFLRNRHGELSGTFARPDLTIVSSLRRTPPSLAVQLKTWLQAWIE